MILLIGRIEIEGEVELELILNVVIVVRIQRNNNIGEHGYCDGVLLHRMVVV